MTTTRCCFIYMTMHPQPPHGQHAGAGRGASPSAAFVRRTSRRVASVHLSPLLFPSASSLWAHICMQPSQQAKCQLPRDRVPRILYAIDARAHSPTNGRYVRHKFNTRPCENPSLRHCDDATAPMTIASNRSSSSATTSCLMRSSATNCTSPPQAAASAACVRSPHSKGMRGSAVPWNMRRGGKWREGDGRAAHTGDAEDMKQLRANTPERWWRECRAGWGEGGGVRR